MNSGHQAFYNTKLIVDNLGQRSQAVGGAGSVGHNRHILGVLIQVNAAHKGGGFLILSGGRNNNFLCTSGNMRGSFFSGAEHAGGLYDILGAAGRPRNLRRILLFVHFDGMAVNDKLTVFRLSATVELAVHGVIFEHINHVVGVDERIVDTYNFKNVRLSHSGAENQATDTAKAIDANFNCHKFLPPDKFLLLFYSICR